MRGPMWLRAWRPADAAAAGSSACSVWCRGKGRVSPPSPAIETELPALEHSVQPSRHSARIQILMPLVCASFKVAGCSR